MEFDLFKEAQKHIISNKYTGDYTSIIFLSVLFILSIVVLRTIINVKIYLLTEKELIIRRPILNFDKKILLTDVENINEEIYTNNFDTYSPYYGRKATITFKDGTQIKFNSYRVSGYIGLMRMLSNEEDNSNTKGYYRLNLDKGIEINNYKRYAYLAFKVLCAIAIMCALLESGVI